MTSVDGVVAEQGLKRSQAEDLVDNLFEHPQALASRVSARPSSSTMLPEDVLDLPSGQRVTFRVSIFGSSFQR
jgi:hypothetical protein